MIKIFNTDLNLIGILEEFTSFQYTVNYNIAGSFKLIAVLTPQIREMLSCGNYIQYKDFIGVIENIALSDANNETATIEVTGCDLLGLLERRIIWSDIYLEGSTEMIIQTLVVDNATNPKDAKRKIDYMKYKTHNLPLTTNKKIQTNHDNLLELISKLADDEEIGLKVTFDLKNKEFLFENYIGEDRTAGKPNQVIIGKAYNNISAQDYTFAEQGQITTVLGLGKYTEEVEIAEGETATNEIIFTVSSGNEETGTHRREVFYESDTTLSDTTKTVTDLMGAVQTEANLQKQPPVEVYDFEVTNVDLAVGDKITVKDNKWNIQFNERVKTKEYTIQNGITSVAYIIGKDV